MVSCSASVICDCDCDWHKRLYLDHGERGPHGKACQIYLISDELNIIFRLWKKWHLVEHVSLIKICDCDIDLAQQIYLDIYGGRAVRCIQFQIDELNIIWKEMASCGARVINCHRPPSCPCYQ